MCTDGVLTYLFSFFLHSTRCSAEVVFRTDPKTNDYIVERGAKRNTDPWKRGLEQEEEETDEARLDRLEREMAEAEGEAVQERNAMAELEAKTADAKREMAVADALDEIRSRNARIEKAHRDGSVVELAPVVLPEDELRRRQEEEDAEAARRAFAKRQGALQEEVILEEGDEDMQQTVAAGSNGSLANVTAATPDPPVPSFKRQVKKKKDHASLLGIKKKQPLV